MKKLFLFIMLVATAPFMQSNIATHITKDVALAPAKPITNRIKTATMPVRLSTKPITMPLNKLRKTLAKLPKPALIALAASLIIPIASIALLAAAKLAKHGISQTPYEAIEEDAKPEKESKENNEKQTEDFYPDEFSQKTPF